MVRQVLPPQPIKVHSGADIHLQPVEDPIPEQVDAPEGDCDPMRKPTLEQAPGRTCDPVEKGAYAGASFLAGLVTPWGTPHGNSPFLKDCNPMEKIHAGAVCEEL
ncbi:hypothetical protein AV530_015336 [Patagioenas fasciata monilis]|uniref:Uncharacterized protein n=1 Tax=Patagioenas fasciata monilis TaxID=372326 RepID=A0A1V4JYF6_PATFA|nr:hypothetical protein AV530_015336 [Patagioenas fasciata monilis]